MNTTRRNPALMPTGVQAEPFVLVAPMSENFPDLVARERDLMELFNSPGAAPDTDWSVLSELFRVLGDEFAAAGASHAAKRCSAHSMRSAQKVRV